MPVVPGPSAPAPLPVGSSLCSAWTTPELVRACCGGLASDYDLTSSIEFATAILFRLSGRQFPGACVQTVWPCQGDSCGGGEDPMWATFAASDWHYAISSSSSHPSTPYRTGAGGWTNCWDCGDGIGSGACGGSCSLPWLTLPGPILSINEIVVNGVVLPPSAYVINDRRRIGRVDGGSWPCSNNLTRPTPFIDPTFSINVNATGGNYSLTLVTDEGDVTASVPATATASALRSAIESVVGAGNVVVSGGPGNVGATQPYLISFSSRDLGYAIDLAVADDTLSGGGAAVNLNVVDAGSVPGPNSWYVTYTFGKPVPPDGVFAASMFACQVALARCGSENCVLPARLKHISREGVEMDFADPLLFIGKNEVGIYEVDLWLNSVNPSKIKRRASVYRADAHPPAKRFT